MTTYKGEILLSEPFLVDANFSRSVILVTEDTEEGSLGFVLNQKSRFMLEDFGDMFQNLEIPVYVGGPVGQHTLHFIHTLGNKIDDAVHVSRQWYWSGQIEAILSLIRIGIVKETEVRFFIGYSGWSKGQLESEFKSKTWFKISDPKVDIFAINPDSLWREILKSQDDSLKQFANYPIDPLLN